MDDWAELLLSRALLSKDQLRAAKEEQNISGDSLESVLLKMGLLSDETLRSVKEHTLGIKSVDLEKISVQPQALGLISCEKALQWHVMPLALEETEDSCVFTFATHKVEDIQFLDRLSRGIENALKKPCRLNVFFATQADIEKAVAQHYGHSLSLDQLLKEVESANENEMAVAHLMDAFLLDAVIKGASDIHFEPEAGFLRVRYRIDGVLEGVKILHWGRWQAMAVRLKLMAGMNIAENRLPQDGRMSRNILGRMVDFRASSVPTLHGENIVLRVLDRNKSVLSLAQLNLNARQEEWIAKLLARPFGILLVVGPTGCGKTTTLYALLSSIQNEGIHVMTLEDPVEYPMPYFRQIGVGEAKLDFSSGVRAMLRHDPDVILIGEIRDAETAQMAFRAAMTGHQVFSTLHAHSALAVLPRLFDLGLPKDILATHLSGVIAQRLVRKLCPHCKKARRVGNDLKEILNALCAHYPELFSADSLIFEAQGCAQCRQGYRFRLPIMEMLMMDEDLEEGIHQGLARGQLQSIAAQKGFVSLMEEGLLRVFAGETSLAELLRVLDFSHLNAQALKTIRGQ